MRKFFKLTVVFTVISIICLVYRVPALANSYPDTLRVGIYYGSGAVQSIDFKCNNGFSIGISSDRSFVPFTTLTDTSVTVTKNPVGTCHIMYSSHGTVSEMNTAISTLRNSGLSVFPAFYNSAYCVFGGAYQSITSATAENDKNATKGTPITVSNSSLCLKSATSGNILFVTDSPTYGLAVFNSNRSDADSFLTISGTAKGTYRGGFECKSVNQSGITVVNIVPTEQYLYSVVCREMSPSWHVEALKTQAVCARNFSYSRLNHHSAYGFDVCRTTCCQAYATTADQTANVHEAVDSTAGELLFYNDELALTVYSSSMGSATESVENVWGYPYPYLVSVPNPYEDTENVNNGKWEKTLTKARATEVMNQKGYNIGTVTDIIVTERTPSGSVLKLLIKGTNGEQLIEREKCRTLFSEATYSQRYTISTGGKIEYPIISIITKDTIQAMTLSSASVLTESGTTKQINEKYVATDGASTKTYNTVSTGGDSNTFTFTGEGWGHGVGMSQYGAKGMAEAGFNYKDILKHYYTGTHLEKAY